MAWGLGRGGPRCRGVGPRGRRRFSGPRHGTLGGGEGSRGTGGPRGVSGPRCRGVGPRSRASAGRAASAGRGAAAWDLRAARLRGREAAGQTCTRPRADVHAATGRAARGPAWQRGVGRRRRRPRAAGADGDMDGSSAENQAPHSKTAVVDTLSMESMPVAAILHHLSLSLSLSPNLPLALSTESA
ncbi:laforin-like [Panicum hallii]|uniref:laforin-like n=1 Tax=Panicum hallii TaxID=206008 RepID=UPI000DF4D0F8|nr:laforin-like [Panicum hallii]